MALAHKFNITGYEECNFNVVLADSKPPDASRIDFMDLLIVSNSGNRPWTIAPFYPVGNSNQWVPGSGLEHYPKEMCSINFLVTINAPCSGPSLLFSFGSRLFNPRSILILVLGKGTCIGWGLDQMNYRHHRRILVPFMTIFLESDIGVVENAVFHCSSCGIVRKAYFDLLVPYSNLQEVAALSAKVKRDYVLPSVAAFSLESHLLVSRDSPRIQKCKHMYKIRPSTSPEFIRCDAGHILIENTAAKLNYSVDFLPRVFAGQNMNPLSVLLSSFPHMEHAVIAILGANDKWEEWSPKLSPDMILKQILQGKSTQKFGYCTEVEEREGFSFSFWVVPFDQWSWLFLGISVLGIIGILRGHWFEIYAILMRQECRILKDRQKLLIIFILATIIFTYGYEGVISSLVIVQPPVIIFKRLKDLIVAQYKVLQFDMIPLRSPFPVPVPDYLTPIISYENITEKPASWISMEDISNLISSDGTWSTNEIIFKRLVGNNVTSLFRTDILKQFKVIISEYTPRGTTCHLARDTIVSNNRLFQFYAGIGQPQLVQVVERLLHSGIVEYYYSYKYFIDNLTWMRRSEFLEWVENMPKLFKMADWKVMSVFIGWAAFLLLSLVDFGLEQYWTSEFRDCTKMFVARLYFTGVDYIKELKQVVLMYCMQIRKTCRSKKTVKKAERWAEKTAGKIGDTFDKVKKVTVE